MAASIHDDPDSVAFQSVGYRRMSTKWPMLEALLGGTTAMRAAGVTFLPQFPQEKDTTYNRRLGGSFLFNAYEDTLSSLSSRPFSKPLTVSPELPERLAVLENDTDGAGTTLGQLGRDLLFSAINWGVLHLLVDYSPATGEESRLEEADLGLRPYFIPMSPVELWGWRTESDFAGVTRLSQIRRHEIRTVSRGRYGDEEREFIRVIEPGRWELFERTDENQGAENGGYTPADAGELSLNEIPLVTVYLRGTGFLTGSPTMESLAWKNIEHWQSSSDQRNLLSYARRAILFGKGISEDDQADGITMGADWSYIVESAEADLKYVEHSGKAMGFGENDLRSIEDQMQELGMAPFTTKSGNMTATAKAIDNSDLNSDIQCWIRAIEKMLRSSFEFAAEFTGDTLPEDFKVSIFNEFSLSMMQEAHLAHLEKMFAARAIQHRTYLLETRRRGLLSEDVDVEEEVGAKEAADAEVAAMLTEQLEANQEDDDDDETQESGSEAA